MSKRYFSIVETVLIEYSCYLPKDFEGDVAEYVEQYGLDALFKNSSHEQILDYLDADKSTISED